MKLLTHPAVTGLGIATLCLNVKADPLISPEHLAVYHYSGQAWPLFAFIIADFVALSLLVTSLLLLTKKPGRRRAVLRSALVFGLLPWKVLRDVYAIRGLIEPPRLNTVVLGSLFAIFLVFVLAASLRSVFERIWEFVATVLGFVAIVGVIAIAQLFWFGYQARRLNTPIPLHQYADISNSGATRTRIIWILLDELSYQQVYERRFPGLQLPALDRLAAQSTVFTHTIPSGMSTDRVIPSLLTGRVIDRLRPSSNGQLAYIRSQDSGQWQRFDQHDTIFQDALDSGYSTAVAGWYNPYCRILPEVLVQCFWKERLPRINGLVQGASFAAKVSDILRRGSQAAESLCFWKTRAPREDSPAAAVHIADYSDISLAADKLIKDRSASFVFLHMPVPHPEGIYDRKTGQFATSHSTYIDNLALADNTLAHIRAVAEQVGDWDSSAIVVMGDHSWRTALWSLQPGLAPEEQLASHGGQFDDRPAYIVKLPYQQEAARIDIPYAAIHTRALLDAILHNQVRSSSELAAWARQQRR